MATFSAANFSRHNFSTNWSGADTHDGPGVGPIRRVSDRERPKREIDKDALRRMLEAAFADAPRDAVVKAVKREHPVTGPVERGIPRVDWSSLLDDLADCLKVLDRYAARIEAGKTRTQRGEKDRDELRYSADSVQEMVSALREQRRRRRRRVAIALLLH
jgi:hypothetical protein